MTQTMQKWFDYVMLNAKTAKLCMNLEDGEGGGKDVQGDDSGNDSHNWILPFSFLYKYYIMKMRIWQVKYLLKMWTGRFS